MEAVMRSVAEARAAHDRCQNHPALIIAGSQRRRLAFSSTISTTGRLV